MSSTIQDSTEGELTRDCRQEFLPDFASAREAARALRDFLSAQGVGETEAFHCELCLVEACNNAVQHVGERGRGQSCFAEAACHGTEVELRVTDHTDGFELPSGPPTPPASDQEHGRGLFIIRSLMDAVRYERNADGNTLVMRKARQLPIAT